MFRKALILVLILLVFMGGPVYASQTYTLEPGKVYAFELDWDVHSFLDVVFSDNVLCGLDNYDFYYDDLDHYDFYGKTLAREVDRWDKFLFVYNPTRSNVTMTVNYNHIEIVDSYDSVFGIVMFDGSESPVEITNISESSRWGILISYDEDSGLLSFGELELFLSNFRNKFDGKGALIIELEGEELKDFLSINGIHEFSDYIRHDFFPRAPWTLVMDFGTLLEVFWGQLRMLLPAGLIVLLVFLLISLTRYIVRLFL